MTRFLKEKIDTEMKEFVSRNLVKPLDCRNPEQIRFYIRELSVKIDALQAGGYVPGWAYAMLAQYNSAHDHFVMEDFRKSYC